jgi:hypothetical protein
MSERFRGEIVMLQRNLQFQLNVKPIGLFPPV